MAKNNNNRNNRNNYSSDDDPTNSILTMAVIGIVGIFVIYYIYTVYIDVFDGKKKDSRPYPKCPDYWEATDDGSCQNTHKIGTCRTGNYPNDTISFNDDIFTNKQTGNYMRCKWAKTCNVPWEGINDLCG